MVELASLMCSSALHNDCFVTGEAAVIASLTLQSDQRKTVAQTPCYHGVGRGWAAVAEFSLDCVMFIDIPSKPDWSKALPSKYLATFRARAATLMTVKVKFSQKATLRPSLCVASGFPIIWAASVFHLDPFTIT